MKILKFFIVFVLFNALLSCSAPSAPKTYSKELVLGKTYTGHWIKQTTKNAKAETYFAVKFFEENGKFYLQQTDAGTSDQDAVSKLTSQTKYEAELNSNTGIISIIMESNTGQQYPAIKFRIQSATEIDRQKINLTNFDTYDFEGKMRLYIKP